MYLMQIIGYTATSFNNPPLYNNNMYTFFKAFIQNHQSVNKEYERRDGLRQPIGCFLNGGGTLILNLQ